MPLIELQSNEFPIEIDIKYSTGDNFTGKPVYKKSLCLLQEDAVRAFRRACEIAQALGYRFRVFDAYRPTEAQWKLWEHSPDPEFLADPAKGSPHSRGVAIDLTLIGPDGRDVDMGTAFDAFTPLSHHGRTDISVEAQTNRLLLLGIMTSAGWDFYRNEWWHYQLFNSRNYPLISDAEAGLGMM